MKDGKYIAVHKDGTPPRLTVKVKGEEVTYLDGTKGKLDALKDWNLTKAPSSVRTIKAECTWGDGPDVLVDLNGTKLILYESPRNPLPPKGSFKHGYINEGSFDLTADEAEALAAQLKSAAEQARELDRQLNEHFRLRDLTCATCYLRKECEFVDDPYNTDGDCLAMK